MVNGAEVLDACLDPFMRYETTRIRQAYDHEASVMPTRYISVSEEEHWDQPLILSVKTFEKRGGGSSFFKSEK